MDLFVIRHAAAEPRSLEVDDARRRGAEAEGRRGRLDGEQRAGAMSLRALFPPRALRAMAR